MNAFTRPQIDHFQAVVLQRADKQSLVRQIDREMIDAAFYVGQRDDLARRLRRSLGGRAQSNGDRNNNEEFSVSAKLPHRNQVRNARAG